MSVEQTTKPKRRFLTPEKKFQIFLETQSPNCPGGEVLRREGIYSTDLARAHNMRRTARQSKEKVFLIVDGHPVHRAKKIAQWVEKNSQNIGLFFLPGYIRNLILTRFSIRMPKAMHWGGGVLTTRISYFRMSEAISEVASANPILSKAISMTNMSVSSNLT